MLKSLSNLRVVAEVLEAAVPTSLPLEAPALDIVGHSAAADVDVKGVSIDSRTIRPGELFFAVRGETTDGHLYIEKALVAGAAAVVAERTALAAIASSIAGGSTAIADAVKGGRILFVRDSLVALQALGAEARLRWGRRVVAVTGSAGKTTTKEMIAAVLATRYRVRKTEGNFNNEYGLPLSLLRIEDDDEV